MKKIFKLLLFAISMGSFFNISMSSCTDTAGDGIDSIQWNGSKNPENSSFRNPIWEPSLEGGTLVKGASSYTAISATTQWAAGISTICPTLSSNNLMSWSAGNSAFSTSPDWAEGRINSLSVDYARAVTGATYWMFYTIEGSNSIGAASGTTAAGPYNDRGVFLTNTDVNSTTLKDPFLIVISTSYYLCYTTDDGTYIQRVTLNRMRGVAKSGAAIKLTEKAFGNVAIVRINSNLFYLVGTVNKGTGTEIRYAMASKITGPYLDKKGTQLTDGSTGELLLENGKDIINPENPMRGIVNEKGTHVFIAYNATQSDKPLMKSGFARKPMFLTPFEILEDGWLKAPTTIQKGWTSPRFQ